MKKFRFSLEPVLDWRTTVQQQEEQTLQLLMLNEATTRSRAEALNDELTRSASDTSAELTSSDLHRMGAYRQYMQGEARNLESKLKQCAQEVDDQRVRCMEAQRNVRMLELLKESKQEAWTKERDKILDGVAMDSYTAASHRATRLERSETV